LIDLFRGGPTSECDIGYKGILCSECIGFNDNETVYYARSGIMNCVECGNMTSEAFKLVGFLILALAYIAILTR
jgi:hypothetical protein